MKHRAAPRAVAVAVAVALALGGCALGPDYERPALPTPPSFRDQVEEPASIADLPWFEVFKDETLQSLVREALTRSRNLLAATARVQQARGLAAVQRGELFPELGGVASASGGDDTTFGGRSTGDDIERNIAVLAASWELDVWGQLRRASEASRAEMLAIEAVRRGVVLSLVSGVAQAYFELRELDLELEIAQRTLKSFEETLRIFDRQFQSGVSSRLDPLRAEAALAQAAAAIPDLERRITAKENELSVLVGRPPGPLERGSALTEQALPPEIPAGVPSVLLSRRPDLLQAEQTLVAANARLGEALASFFPKIGLTSVYGSTSDDLSDLLSSGTRILTRIMNAAGPLFSFGRTWYFWRASQAATEAAAHEYEQTVLVALREVSDALVAREKLVGVRVEQERAVRVLDESLTTARKRYLGGLSTYLEVLDAQQDLFPAENALAQTRRDELFALVAVYRALGGGWSEAGPSPEVPSALRP
jgi:multidrug efflux system outer membrane protein